MKISRPSAAAAVRKKILAKVSLTARITRTLFNEPLGYISIALLFLVTYLISGFWVPYILRESGGGDTVVLE
ncbi:MAG: hypothetical protein MUO76_08655 [Anaerolineaceae bacterium]|nr:hypothetical protein [Anaerolineaceae bacterium]